MLKSLRISTPGRVCLFGEHQDYLHLPVVAAAISLRISIQGIRRNDNLIKIQLPDILEEKVFDITQPVIYTEERDYFKSSLKVLLRNDYTFSSGFNCIVRGEIPINAGTSSSSALIVTWINFLARMSDQSVVLPPEKLAQYSYEAEVLEFSEPGGMMDQYSTSFGKIIAIDFFPEVVVTKMDTNLKTFVLGNSLEPKDTKFILSHVKDQILAINFMLRKIDPEFSLQIVNSRELENYKNNMTDSQYNLLQGTVRNRDLTCIARKELIKDPDHRLIGELLNEHQMVLKDILGISTAKIDKMIESSLNAGAYGAKINGSGGGGCMFAYAPENPDKIKSAIEAAGGEAYIIHPDSGSQVEEEIS